MGQTGNRPIDRNPVIALAPMLSKSGGCARIERIELSVIEAHIKVAAQFLGSGASQSRVDIGPPCVEVQETAAVGTQPAADFARDHVAVQRVPGQSGWRPVD